MGAVTAATRGHVTAPCGGECQKSAIAIDDLGHDPFLLAKAAAEGPSDGQLYCSAGLSQLQILDKLWPFKAGR